MVFMPRVLVAESFLLLLVLRSDVRVLVLLTAGALQILTEGAAHVFTEGLGAASSAIIVGIAVRGLHVSVFVSSGR
jgi:hypothetical protein